MTKSPPDDLKDWSKNDLVRELRRLRAVLREHAERPGSEPTAVDGRGAIIDVASNPHARGGVLLDVRNAVLMDATEVVLVDTKQDERPAMMMSLRGRVNYRTDRAEHVYLFGPDGAAALVSEIVGLAQRAGDRFAAEFGADLDRRIEELP